MAENVDSIPYSLRLDYKAENEGDTELLKACDEHVLARPGAAVICCAAYILGLVQEESKRLEGTDPKFFTDSAKLRMTVKQYEAARLVCEKCGRTLESSI